MFYHDSKKVRKGDIFQVSRWGTCEILKYDKPNGSFIARNTQTGEIFDMLGQDTFSEADLIERKKF